VIPYIGCPTTKIDWRLSGTNQLPCTVDISPTKNFKIYSISVFQAWQTIAAIKTNISTGKIREIFKLYMLLINEI